MGRVYVDGAASGTSWWGALAVLSDIGRREDIERVRRFLDHPVRRVAAEARRTLGILELG